MTIQGTWRSILTVFLVASPLTAQQPSGSTAQIHPLSLKEEMVRDRFMRFQDRVFRLREELGEKEPATAARLAAALERAGELGLAGELDRLVDVLKNPALLADAADAQAEWVSKAERLLSLLLEEETRNEDRDREIEKLQEYRKELDRLLSQQKSLRSESGKAAEARRMLQDIEQALKRVQALQQRQNTLSKQAKEQSQASDSKEGSTSRQDNVESKQDGADTQLQEEQEDLSREAKELASDLKRLSESRGDESAETDPLASAREKTGEAGESAESGSKSMSKASEKFGQGQKESAQSDQKSAEEALKDAKEKLEAAREEVARIASKENSEKMAGRQRETLKDTRKLADEMRRDTSGERPPSSGDSKKERGQNQQGDKGEQGQEGQEDQQGQKGQKGQQGQKDSKKQPQNPPPVKNAPNNLDRAEQEMDDASEKLEEDQPEDAAQPQDRAIDQLEQAQQEMDEVLMQLRKEEREEMLRDLESRFRDMLARQRQINEATHSLNEAGPANIRRAEQLQLSEMSLKQRALSEKAATCVHILDEEGTTIAFPHIVEQVSQDMKTVADRLAAYQLGPITLGIQEEIVDALDQLLEALRKMREENKQQGMQSPGGGAAGQNPPLLPPSAELKLLRSSQFRVNTRTKALEAARDSGTEPEAAVKDGLLQAAKRQAECADIARKMRDLQP